MNLHPFVIHFISSNYYIPFGSSFIVPQLKGFLFNDFHLTSFLETSFRADVSGARASDVACGMSIGACGPLLFSVQVTLKVYRGHTPLKTNTAVP